MASEDSSSPYVVAEGVRLTYPNGVAAVDTLDLRIPRGQFVSIVGPSGCGKSTLLRLLAGLLAPSGGTVSIAGESPQQARSGRAPMSFVFQDATLLPWRTVRENVRLPLELMREPPPRQDQEIAAALKLVALTDFASQFPAELSGGMRMRVSLARALVTEPKLLLLDEPFAALDDITRTRLNEDLLQLWQQSGWTAVFVTHNIAEAIFLSQRVLLMSRRPGRIVADIPIDLPATRSAEIRATPEFGRLLGQISDQLRRYA